jgi:MoaA/NifB/PqqE/SkfB family radical SAM enzyme
MRTAALDREESIARNREELAQRRVTLSAPPRLVTLGAHAGCNARCVFCPPESFPRFDLGRYKEFFEGRMGHFIRQAEKVTFTGYGEVLWSPDAVALLDYLNETIPETWKIFTTNGTPLRPEVMERLLKSRYSIQVSLHAAHAAMHEELTGLRGAFAQIMESVGWLCRRRRELGIGDRLHVVLVDVVTRKSIGELADLVQMAWDLKAPEVQCNYVTMYQPEHFELSPFFAQEEANAAIAAAEARLKEVRRRADPEEFRYFSVRLPQRFGRTGGVPAPEGFCAEPWEHVYVEVQGPVLPCCYWGAHVGDLAKGDDIDAVWNSDFYRGIRAALASGQPHPWCAHCVKYQGYSVDSLLGHITNRPDAQKRLLKEIEVRGLADVSAYWPQVEAAERLMPR